MTTPAILIHVVKYHAYISFECLECFQQTIVDCGHRAFPLDEENLSSEDELECHHCKTMHHTALIDNKLIIKEDDNQARP
jgi:hypothetical protein